MSAGEDSRPAEGAPADAADAPILDPREPPRASPGQATLIAGGVTLATALVVGWAFDPARAGSAAMLVAMAALYAPGAAATLLWLRRRGELRATLRPSAGDLTIGAVLAALLYGAAMGAHLLVTSRGSPREAWIIRVYLQIGDPAASERVFVSGAVFVIAALEEIVWRGLVLRALEGPLGHVRAWVLSSALYAAAHLPTVFLLADPVAGPNPLLVVAAFGCGAVWGRVNHRFGRLLPAIFAHAFFSWAVVSFPIWHP